MLNSPSPYDLPQASLGDAFGYDIIGDVHGCAQSLQRLLEQLGYRKRNGVYEQARRKAIFLGDIIDRGPRIREALGIVRGMVERGSALMILGNHEFNAITYSTLTDATTNQYLRPHTPRNSRQIAETLAQFEDANQEWLDYVAWFKTLPLFLELQHPLTQQVFRCVHACWDQYLINLHRQDYPSGGIDMDFIRHSAEPGSQAALIKQRLTGGVDIKLPRGMAMSSEDGYQRTAFRTKFWANNVRTYGEMLFQPDPLPEPIAAAEISPQDRARMVFYDIHQPPLFVGHYWLKGQPAPLTANLACLDYSAVKYGRLVAYRMEGEAQLRPENFVWVYVDP